jgi:small subunit ribosomal protein S5
MDTNNQKNNTVAVEVNESSPAEEKVVSAVSPAHAASGRPSRFAPRPQMGGQSNDPRSKNPRRPMNRDSRPRNEFDQKMLNIRRVARVATGGRRFQFSVALVAGDKKGKVGVGLGKAGDTSLAIDKALRNAKKNMIVINTTKTSSISHEVTCKYSSAMVVIRPAPGRGIVAGSAIRNVLELAGIKDVTAKILSGSKNKLNIARATILALSELAPVKVKKVETK